MHALYIPSLWLYVDTKFHWTADSESAIGIMHWKYFSCNKVFSEMLFKQWKMKSKFTQELYYVISIGVLFADIWTGDHQIVRITKLD